MDRATRYGSYVGVITIGIVLVSEQNEHSPMPACTLRRASAIVKVRWATTSRRNPAQPWLDAPSRRLGGDRLCSYHECAHLVCRMAVVHRSGSLCRERRRT